VINRSGISGETALSVPKETRMTHSSSRDERDALPASLNVDTSPKSKHFFLNERNEKYKEKMCFALL
jgi:hypothetical protein